MTIIQNTQLHEEDKVAIPDEIRETLGIKAGDSIVWSIDDDGTVRLRRLLNFEELAGSLPPLDRHVDADFGNIIREAMDDHADRVVARMNGEYDDE